MDFIQSRLKMFVSNAPANWSNLFLLQRLRVDGGGRASNIFGEKFNYLTTTFLFVDGFYADLA